MSEKNSEFLFEFKNVSYQINGNQILKDLSFKVFNKGITGILGSSGSGKSTLLHLYNKLLSPTQGQILYQNEDIKSISSRNLRKQVGLVQQTPFLFPGTVLTNILYGSKIWGVNTNEKRINHLLDIVGLPKSLINKDVSQLSGGEQQRVNFIRTLANYPKVLLLDEPTSSLDISTEKMVENTIVSMSKQEIGIIIVTHSLEQAKRITNQVIVLKGGYLEQETSTIAFFQENDNETIQKMFDNDGGERQ